MVNDIFMEQKALGLGWIHSEVACELCSSQHRCLPVGQIWFAPVLLAGPDKFLYPYERQMRFHNLHCLVPEEHANASDTPLEQTP